LYESKLGYELIVTGGLQMDRSWRSHLINKKMIRQNRLRRVGVIAREVSMK
jgi:hypothetical protein